MALPKIVDFVKIKEWIPVFKSPPSCFLYNFKSLGITPKQFADVFVGRTAVLFEKPFLDRITGTNCPWCEYKAPAHAPGGKRLMDHIFTHPGKTILSYQLVKFQKEMHTLKLQFIRKGFHEAVSFFVEYSCQDCLNPSVRGREGMCAIPLSARPRMRSLKFLGYPIQHLVNHPKRKYQWSALGIIVLMKTEVTELDIP
jgi:hypothetical protein